MEVSEMNNPSHEQKTSNALKADRVIHRVTFSANKASLGEILHIPVSKLDDSPERLGSRGIGINLRLEGEWSCG